VSGPRRLSLGSIAGTTLAIDPAFFLLLAYFVFSYVDEGIRIALLWLPIVFFSVLLHELAHAATIAAFGYGPSQVVLGMMGGVTINERRARPWHDTLISFAGPLASLLLALICWQLLVNVPSLRSDPMLGAMLPRALSANVFWAIFNMVPVQPLDGGHVVRNLLRVFLSERRAFIISIWSSIIFGVLIAILAVRLGVYFAALMMALYVQNNFAQWQMFRSFRPPPQE
jgi:Zn-dependent protease